MVLPQRALQGEPNRAREPTGQSSQRAVRAAFLARSPIWEYGADQRLIRTCRRADDYAAR